MKNRYLLIIFCQFIISNCLAQQENAHWVGNEFEIGTSYRSFGDNLIVRSQPDIQSEKLTIIPIGESVTLLSVTNNTVVINDDKSVWLKVTLQDDTIGYLASTFLATGSRELKSGKTLLYKRRGKEPTANLYFRVIATDQPYVDLGSFRMQNADFDLILNYDKGLSGIDHVITIDYLAEACGVQAGMEYFTLNLEHGKLQHLGSFSSVADAGIFYSYEHLIFPKDEQGQQGYIIYEGEETYMLDDALSEHRNVKMSKMYKWEDGTTVEPIKKFNYN